MVDLGKPEDPKDPKDPMSEAPLTSGQQPAAASIVPASKDSRNLAMLAHLLGAFVSFLGPLVIWLVKKDEDPFVDDQGKEALNFQLSLLIWHLVAVVLATITCGVLFFLPLGTLAMQIIFGIVAAVKSSGGEAYRYPLTIRFIK